MSDYALITPEGELSFGDGEWRDQIGREGPSRVPLMPDVSMSGWVNDCGLVLPDRYPRNVIGGLTLIILGARPQPYAGPAVITGWHCSGPFGAYEHEIAGHYADYVKALVDDLARVLDGQPPESEFARDAGAGWPGAVRDAAEMIRTADAPPVQIITRGFPFGGLN